MKNYYEILGISKSASTDEIKKAFYKLAHKCHPDKGGDSEKFKEINEAYQVLSDEKKRAQYDQFGQTFDDSQFGGSSSPFGQGSEGFDGFDASSIEDLFGDLFGGASPFGSSRGASRKRETAQEIVVDVSVSLQEVFSGTKRQISLRKYIVCDKCSGSGADPGSKINTCPSCGGEGKVKEIRRTFLGSFAKTTICPQCKGEGSIPEKECQKCKGEGRVKELKKASFAIPAGISEGEIMKFAGEGDAGGKGRDSGDFYVRVHIEDDARFKRREDDIFYNFEVDFSQAALGDKIDIPTLGGKIELKIPSGTQAGKLLRLKGMGLPHYYGRGKGDMFVKVSVKTPTKLTREQKELIEKLKEEGI